MNQFNENCLLCSYNKNFDIIYEDKEKFIAFDNYPMNNSHILVSPKAHVLSSSDCLYIDLLSWIKKVIILYRQEGMTAIVYEHGNKDENKTSNESVDHAHIHIIGVAANQLRSQEMLNVFRAKSVHYKNLDMFFKKFQALPYHMISINGCDTCLSIENYQSQVFRENLSVIYKIPYWDWKTDGERIVKISEAEYNAKNRVKENISNLLADDWEENL